LGGCFRTDWDTRTSDDLEDPDQRADIREPR
jgi:hypothetical protein